MSHANSRSRRRWSAALVYLIVLTSACFVASFRSRTMAERDPLRVADALVNRGTSVATKPFFSLATHRTYGTAETPRLWIDYHGLENLDFRVYRINEPVKFFTQLSNPHQMGDREEEQLATTLKSHPSLLERVHALKQWATAGIKSYVRSQIQQDSRKSFNQKFRAEEPARRTPLNVADYARVPLLNRNQLVTSWREPLPPLENQYDRRMVPLEKPGAGVYLVEAVGGDLRAYTVVVVTDLAMVEKTTRDGELVVYTVDRKTGEPRADAHVDIIKARKNIASGTTDREGILRTKIGKQSRETDDATGDDVDNSGFVILANQRDNFAISDLESFYFGGYAEEENEGTIRGYVYTDRPVYRPTHKVYFKGILRSVDEQGQYRPLKDQTVSVTVEDADNAKISEQELPLSARGTFNGDLNISDEAPLGTYRIVVHAVDGSATGTFQVAEYKKPEYKVNVSAPKGFLPAGEKTKLAIDARYFFGAPVAGAEVKYYIYRSHYYPWSLGQDTEDETNEETENEDEYSRYGNYGSDMVQDSEAKLDANGHLDVDFEVPASNENDIADYQYRIEAQVTDSSRRTIDGAGSFVATRGNIVAHALPDRYVYKNGETARVTITTTDYEGRPVSAKVSLKFIERTWTRVEKKENEYGPGYEMHERELVSADVNTDAQGHGTYEYLTTAQGSISIKTIITEGGKQFSSLGGFVWVTGDSEWSDSSYFSEDYEAIKLVPDKKSYHPGETAHVLAILPTDSANLLVTTELTTVTSAKHVNAPGKSVIIDVPVMASFAPNVFLNVTYVKDGQMYTSEQRLVVPARDKVLNLEIMSNKKEYKPRETASYTILARTADGTPVPDAEVSLGVIDEAIYSVAPDFSGNIRQEFYGMRYNTVETHLSISYTFTGYAGEKPIDLARNKSSYQLADFKNDGELVEPIVRKQFKDTAFWQPSVLTGPDGRATVKVRLPDNLTTWRATARGVTADTKVGATRYKVVARKDVILRLATPRFLTAGDTVTLSAIVHNYLKEAKSTQISISVLGAQLISPSQQTVTIEKQGEHRIDWQISAPQTGEIKLLAKALTNTESDAVELTLNVVPRGLHETKNETWATSNENSEQQISLDLPSNADVNTRKLRLEVSPSVAGTLFGALDYLTTYPYGCTEQTMSSFLPNIIVAQVLKDVKSASISDSNNLQKKVERGRDRLYSFQHSDGGWGWWKRDQSDPFMTAYVIDGLTQASQAGYEIDEGRASRGREKLHQMLVSGTTEAGTIIDDETRAFMLYALVESGGVEGEFIDKLFADRGKLQPYGRALLALTLKLNKDNKRAWDVATEIESAAITDRLTTHWESKRKAMLDFAEANDTEATALSLKALARIKPDSSLMSRTARWLVSERRNSYYWSSTKDTAFAIFGLIDYVKVSHELTPDYEVEIYLNGETVLTEHVTNASAAQTFLINRKGNGLANSNQLRVVKRGKGSLYFSSSVDYFTNDTEVPARGVSELSVTREYLRLQVAEDGYQLKWTTTPLIGEIHSGDLIVVRLHLAGGKARHLMLEDPIPAGAEQLESLGNLNLDYTAGNWTDWYSSREFRDQRTVFFLDNFDGDATLQYAMRVQVPGEFVIAPARAELMYAPETHANTSSRKISFLDRVTR